MAVEDLTFQTTKEWEALLKRNPWRTFVPEFARDASGQGFMRGRGRKVIYRVVSENQGNQEYVCNTCGSEIQGVSVAHPIQDGPFPLSGSGKCAYEDVPYCPKCEQKPNFHGAATRVKDTADPLDIF
jgi:hypothetical protein